MQSRALINNASNSRHQDQLETCTGKVVAPGYVGGESKNVLMIDETDSRIERDRRVHLEVVSIMSIAESDILVCGTGGLR